MTRSRGWWSALTRTPTHDVAMLDDCGRQLARGTFAAEAAGYRALCSRIERSAPVAGAGVGSTGGSVAGLVGHLRAEGLEVFEVTQPHPRPRPRRRRGTSDPIDAELAARHVLAAAHQPVVAQDTSRVVEAICRLRVARGGAVKARRAGLAGLGGPLVSARSSWAH